MDGHLAAIARAAEQGRPCPIVRLIVSGQMMIGVPVPSNYFVTASQQSLTMEWEHWSVNRPKRDRREQPVDPAAIASERLEPLGEAVAAGPDAGVITLRDVHWRFAGGILDLPALRVALDAVDAWWVVGGRALQGEEVPAAWFI